MDHREAGKYWDGNADAWTRLARAGFDVYRDHLNTPAFLAMLPDVRGLRGLDVGCGEGHNTRLLAGLGAELTAMDVSPRFVAHAAAAASSDVRCCCASAVQLPFIDAAFDFATAFMSLMDIPETMAALREIHRVVRPGGFLQFSITHPCFNTPQRRNLRDLSGRTYAIEVGDYFKNIDGEIDKWLFGQASAEAKAGLAKFQTPRFHRTVSEWLNLLIELGWTIERVEEPHPSEAAVQACPAVQDAQVVAYFLHVRARKPADRLRWTIEQVW